MQNETRGHPADERGETVVEKNHINQKIIIL
jgi:hypothetical protein